MVAAGRHYAVAAGVRVLQQGGNATDAGVAAVLAAAVTEFSHFGMGGEAPMMVYDRRDDAVSVVNGQGPAPKASTPQLFESQGFIDGNGPRGMTVPAVIDAAALALQHHGSMRLEQVMAPALEYADGFPMYAALRQFMIAERAATEQWEWSAKTYYPGGRIPAVGEIFRQPNLADTMRRLVAAEQSALSKSNDRNRGIQAGRDEFYKGGVARRIAAAVLGAGGLLSYEDLASYAGDIEKALRVSFKQFEIFKADTWNQGGALLETLNILEGCDLASMGFNSAEYIHTVHEAIKLAFDDRNAFFGDPRFAKVPIEGLLSKAYAAERRGQIRPDASLEHRWGNPYAFDPKVFMPEVRYSPHVQGQYSGASADTTAIQVVDRQGNLFSSTASSGWLYRGGFVAGDTGVPMGNRMTVFDLDPRSPNVLVGGKRPRTTLTPTIVFKDGRPLMAIGTPGGDSQDQQILNVLLNVMVFDADIQQAIEAPRFNSLHFHSSFFEHPDHPGLLEVEDRIAPEVLRALEARGHHLQVLSAFGMSTGVVAAGLLAATSTLFGAADPRRERYVFGW
jgi:gamma-glutamyltranspeptidase/glutathione hydrolase